MAPSVYDQVMQLGLQSSVVQYSSPRLCALALLPIDKRNDKIPVGNEIRARAAHIVKTMSPNANTNADTRSWASACATRLLSAALRLQIRLPGFVIRLQAEQSIEALYHPQLWNWPLL